MFFDAEDVTLIQPNSTMLDVLVHVGIFSSKSQDRKNWNNIASKLDLKSFEIPEGWSDFDKVGKLKHRITILNATPLNLIDFEE